MTTDINEISTALVGKTIEKIESKGVNVIVLLFTDGTSKEFWAESSSVPFIFMDEHNFPHMDFWSDVDGETSGYAPGLNCESNT